MDQLPSKTLQELLQTYDTAIRELRSTHDQFFRGGGLLGRLEHRRAEVIARLEAKQTAAIGGANGDGRR